MKNLTKEQVEIIKDQIEESVSCGNMYPNVARTLVDMLNEAINYNQCCKSDSELLLAYEKFVDRDRPIEDIKQTIDWFLSK